MATQNQNQNKTLQLEQQPTPTPTRDWAHLPKEILHRIGLRYMNWTTDLTRVRGVCKEWHSSIPLVFPAPFPVPPLPHAPDLLLGPSSFILFTHPSPNQGPFITRAVHLMSKSRPNNWHLMNPLSLHDYFFSTPSLTSSLSLLTSNALELSRTFTLINEAKPVSKKVVGGWNFSSDPDFVLLAHLEGGGGLVVFTMEDGEDSEWTPVKGTKGKRKKIKTFDVGDIAFMKKEGKFYAFDVSGWRVGVIDPERPEEGFVEFIPGPDVVGEGQNGEKIVTLDDGCFAFKEVYLVPGCNDKLYVVFKVQRKTDEGVESDFEEKPRLVVFVLKGRTESGVDVHEWVEVKTFDDQVFFIGKDVAFALPNASQNLPLWKPNSICLMRMCTPLSYDAYVRGGGVGGAPEGGVGGAPEGMEFMELLSFVEYWKHFFLYDMNEPERGIVRFEYLPRKVYTGVFFPPPAWMKWSCPSLGIDDVEFHKVKFLIDGGNGQRLSAPNDQGMYTSR